MQNRITKSLYPLLIMLFIWPGCARIKTAKLPVPQTTTKRPETTTKHLEPANVSSETFEDYWYNYGAELTRYQLDQERYGEVHKGDAVLIFVTEGFLPGKQVKADNPESHPEVVPILKLNLTKNFNTGIYPYSIMSSTFTPINIDKYPHTLKVATSTQEWCGHVYAQMNIRDDIYKILTLSYFEKEVSDIFELNTAFLEDEVWTRIRIDPSSLPKGTIQMIPGLITSRLLHRKLTVETVEATLEEYNDDLLSYTIDYIESERKLKINFKKYFPYEIVSWEETYKSGKGDKAKTLTTKAVKTHSMMSDYWNKHFNVDLPLRKKLGLYN